MPQLFRSRPDIKAPDFVSRLCGRVPSQTIRNFWIDGRRTSLRLEGPFIRDLTEIADREGMEVDELVTAVAACRQVDSLTGAIRLFVLAYWRDVALGSPRAADEKSECLTTDHLLAALRLCVSRWKRHSRRHHSVLNQNQT